MYQLGRNGGQNDTFISHNRSYISKNHIAIKIELKDVYDLKKSSIRLTIQSRASTVINGEKHKLDKNQDPYYKDYNENITMTFKDPEEKFTIEWVEFNIFISLNKEGEVLKVYNDGVDLRIVDDPFIATHYIKPLLVYDHLVVLAKGIPEIELEWLHVHTDAGELEGKPNLFLRGMSFIVKEDDTSKALLTLLGANIISYDNESKLKSVLDSHPDYLVFDCRESKASQHILKSFPERIINEKSVLDALLDPDIQLYKDIRVSQSPQRKRRKYNKPNILGYFDSLMSQGSQDRESSELEEKPIDKRIMEKESTEKKSTEKKSTVEKSTEKKSTERKPIPTEKESKPINPPQIQNESPIEIHQQNELTSPPIDKDRKRPNQESEHPSKKPKKEQSDSKPPKIGKFMPQYSFYEAVKATKGEAAGKILHDLGLDPEADHDEVNERLSNLAVVETMEVPPRKHVETDNNNNYEGRVNFKKFKKNIKLGSVVTRSFVGFTESNEESKPVPVGETNLDPEEKMAQDFNGVMNDISGYNPNQNDFQDEEEDPDENGFSFSLGRQNSGLFVEADSQTTEKPVTRTRKVQTKPVSEDDDDEDEDDVPKFTFSRR